MPAGRIPVRAVIRAVKYLDREMPVAARKVARRVVSEKPVAPRMVVRIAVREKPVTLLIGFDLDVVSELSMEVPLEANRRFCKCFDRDEVIGRLNCRFAVNDDGVVTGIANELTGCNKCSPNNTTPMQCLQISVRLGVFIFIL